MALRLLPDVEALTIAYLRGQTAITTLVGTRVYTRLPKTPIWPLITVAIVAGTERIADHLDEVVIQIDAWGFIDTDPGVPANTDHAIQAHLVARTARAVLLLAPLVAHSRGVVSHVRTIRPAQPLPDTTYSPARPRYSLDMAVTVHPLPL